MSNSLWVIVFGIISFEGPPQFICKCYECENGISLSLYPWTISVGQLTFYITSIFLNLSFTSSDGIDPRRDLTASFKEV